MNDLVNANATFESTQWAMVIEARDTSSPEALTALGELCRVYWYPLYVYARGRGHTVEDAQDLTQGFFCRLLEKNYLGIADRKKGRFRWFLLTAFKRFLANQHDFRQATKRGGGKQPLSLEAVPCEADWGVHNGATPDREFDRQWALAILEQAQKRLREEYATAGKGERYCWLEDHLPGQRAGTSYTEVSAALGISEGAVKVEVHRMKKRLGELLRDEVSQTVTCEKEIDDELRYLVSAIF
jgi:DNA-directed RNA polymerase specialized sigma24 family protein